MTLYSSGQYSATEKKIKNIVAAFMPQDGTALGTLAGVLQGYNVSTVGMQVNFSAGRAVVPCSSPDMGVTLVTSDSVSSVALAGSDPNYPRIDRIVLMNDDGMHGENSAVIQVLKGANATSGDPVSPSQPQNSTNLATILVPARATSVTANNDVQRVSVSPQDTLYYTVPGQVIPNWKVQGSLTATPLNTTNNAVNGKKKYVANVVLSYIGPEITIPAGAELAFGQIFPIKTPDFPSAAYFDNMPVYAGGQGEHEIYFVRYFPRDNTLNIINKAAGRALYWVPETYIRFSASWTDM